MSLSFSRACTIESRVHTAGYIALEHGLAHVPAPHRQTRACTLFKIVAAHIGPAGVAGKHPAACLNLIVDIYDAKQPTQPASDLNQRCEFL